MINLKLICSHFPRKSFSYDAFKDWINSIFFLLSGQLTCYTQAQMKQHETQGKRNQAGNACQTSRTD